jgi:hypothetical protein
MSRDSPSDVGETFIVESGGRSGKFGEQLLDTRHGEKKSVWMVWQTDEPIRPVECPGPFVLRVDDNGK